MGQFLDSTLITGGSGAINGKKTNGGGTSPVTIPAIPFMASAFADGGTRVYLYI